jgi:hypothetical protein
MLGRRVDLDAPLHRFRRDAGGVEHVGVGAAT